MPPSDSEPPDGLGPLPSTDLVEQVVDRLRTAILSKQFGADGDLPSQGELATRLGVSRSVVREAMRVLQSQGFLEISQGRRPRVKPPSSDELSTSLEHLVQRAELRQLHLSELRLPLETEIAALAAERASAEDEAELALTIERLRSAGAVEDQAAADVDFHQVLARATRNPLFALLLESLARLLRESRLHTLALGGADIAADDHEAILEAVARRDPGAAREIMNRHLAASRDVHASRVVEAGSPGDASSTTADETTPEDSEIRRP